MSSVHTFNINQSGHVTIKKITNAVTGNEVLGLEFHKADTILKVGFRIGKDEEITPKKCSINSGDIKIRCTDISKISKPILEVAHIFDNMDKFYNDQAITRSGRKIIRTQKTHMDILSELYHKEFIIVNSIIKQINSFQN